MNSIKGYLLSVVGAAIICAVINTLFGKKSVFYSLVRLLSGIFLIVTIVSPWRDFSLTSIVPFTDDVSDAASMAAETGTESYKQALGEIIKSKTEAYILDKAVSMGLDIDVEVTLSSSDPPLPQRIKITGAVSPYAKEKLLQCIAKDLAVPEDELIWN